jgi:hypothetical protein
MWLLKLLLMSLNKFQQGNFGIQSILQVKKFQLNIGLAELKQLDI